MNVIGCRVQYGVHNNPSVIDYNWNNRRNDRGNNRRSIIKHNRNFLMRTVNNWFNWLDCLFVVISERGLIVKLILWIAHNILNLWFYVIWWECLLQFITSGCSGCRARRA
jgi:hypothetical protein